MYTKYKHTPSHSMTPPQSPSGSAEILWSSASTWEKNALRGWHSLFERSLRPAVCELCADDSTAWHLAAAWHRGSADSSSGQHGRTRVRVATTRRSMLTAGGGEQVVVHARSRADWNHVVYGRRRRIGEGPVEYVHDGGSGSGSDSGK